MPFQHIWSKTLRTQKQEDRVFFIYRKEEEELPPYISIGDLPSKAYTLQVGDYAETLDGFLVPVTHRGTWREQTKSKWYKQEVLRFASHKSVTVPISRIQRGLYYPIYSKLHTYMEDSRYRTWANADLQLNRFEEEFCWSTAMTMNPNRVLSDLSLVRPKYAGTVVERMFKKKVYATAS